MTLVFMTGIHKPLLYKEQSASGRRGRTMSFRPQRLERDIRFPVGEKQWTPVITAQQIQNGIASILHRDFGCDTASRITTERTQRLTRNELARLYDWKQQKRTAPLNVNKRQT